MESRKKIYYADGWWKIGEHAIQKHVNGDITKNLADRFPRLPSNENPKPITLHAN